VIRVLIADDHSEVRSTIRALLSLEPQIEVVAEAARGDEVLAAAARNKADVVLLDFEMPGGGGMRALSDLQKESSPSRAILLVTLAKPGLVAAALSAGAAGIIFKEAPPSEMARTIQRVARGEQVVDPRLAPT
jgi:two-component system response regulator DesR